MKQYYQSVIIREYLWNCGDIDEMIEGFNMAVKTDDVNFNDFEYVIHFIEDFVPNELIKQFDSLGDKRAQFIDEYEEKIVMIINQELQQLKELFSNGN